MFYGSRFAEDGLPTVRKPGHVWAALHEESPKNNQYLFQKKIIAELFNFSSTYKRQSDYPIPTMWLNHPDYVTDTVYMVPITEKNRVRKEGLAPVVFVQSDCQTPSDRGHYIEMLMKHVAVDSYGRCMNNKKLPDKLVVTPDVFIYSFTRAHTDISIYLYIYIYIYIYLSIYLYIYLSI